MTLTIDLGKRYNPDQPRDQRGRWTDSPAGHTGVTLSRDDLSAGTRNANDKALEQAAERVGNRWNVNQDDFKELAQEEGIWAHIADAPHEEQRRRFAASLMTHWRGSSGSPVAVAAITAVADRLGMRYALAEGAERGANEWIRQRPGMHRAVAALGDAMYEASQQWFADRGIARVNLVRSSRGLDFDADRPFTSWAAERGGTNLVHGEGRIMREEAVPIERIFSLPETGFGSADEFELVVLPGRVSKAAGYGGVMLIDLARYAKPQSMYDPDRPPDNTGAWVWIEDELLKYESWWPRDARGRWIKRSHLGAAMKAGRSLVEALREDEQRRSNGSSREGRINELTAAPKPAQPRATARLTDNHADAPESDTMQMSEARRAELAHTIEDFAGTYHRSPMRGSEARYIAERAKATPAEWEWIADYMRQHPEVLQGPVTDFERDKVRAVRNAAADKLSDEALAAWKAGNTAEALRLIGEGEKFRPKDQAWDWARGQIRAGVKAQDPTPASPAQDVEVDLFGGGERELTPAATPPPPARKPAHKQGDLFSGDADQFFGQSDVFSQLDSAEFSLRNAQTEMEDARARLVARYGDDPDGWPDVRQDSQVAEYHALRRRVRDLGKQTGR